ncbi:MAG TPA: hypothetical protein PLA83_12745, partial [Deltaproteobacteria bacterium]|nr:hypothetical protein [Deltaproteobacteria bacterium]
TASGVAEATVVIASAIGTIPETLSRLIDRLKGRGIISWDSRTLKVKKDYLGQFTEESDLLED